MASLSSIRDTLATRLGTISGLRVFDTVPDTVPTPAAIVGGPQHVDYQRPGHDVWLIPVRVYVGGVSDRAVQDALDGYLASSGPTSVRAALESDRTMATRVRRAQSYGTFQVGTQTLLGVEFLVEVIA